MASSADTPSSSTCLDVIIPIGLKRTRAPPESEVADALKNSSTLSKFSIIALANKKDKKRKLNNVDQLAEWLAKHGSQLTELVLSMDEADEVQLVSNLFKCPDLKLTKLQVSAADIPKELLQKLPQTLELFSGHLGARGDLAPFAALPKLQTLAVRCYPTQRIDGNESTAKVPLALLHHSNLQCLVIDATSFVYITDKDAECQGAQSQLKVLAITGSVDSADAQMLIDKALGLQQLCLRVSTLSQLYGMGESGSIALNLGKLANLRAVELGFPLIKATYSGLQHLGQLSASLLCGQFGAHKPALPKALAEAYDEPTPEIAAGQMIARTATIAGSKQKYKIGAAFNIHSTLVVEPKKLALVLESIVADE